MKCRILAIALCACSLLLAEDLRVSKTETVDFPAGGILSFHHSTGDLIVTGWDRPNIEITVVKTAWASKDQEKAKREIDRVQIASERKGVEMSITTHTPRRSGVDVQYQINVPHNVQVNVDHVLGEVHIDDVSGPLHVTDRRGGITVRLAGAAKPAIDAKSNFGTVESDFSGKELRKRIFGRAFTGDSSTGAQPVYLRIGYGDIRLIKAIDQK